MLRRFAMLLAVVAPFRAAAQGVPVATNPVGADSDRLCELFPSRVHTVVKASYDPDDRISARNQGNDDGFSGVNHTEAYRTDVGASQVAMLADFEGRSGVLGLFFRNFWSDSGGVPMLPGENNRTRIWIDGQVRHDMPLWDYFRNPSHPQGQVPPFAGPFTGNRAGGHLTHAQLRWNQSFRLGLDDDGFANAARFHRVSATLASPEGELPVPNLDAWTWIARRRGNWPHAARRQAVTTALALPANGGRAALQLSGPQTLLELTFEVPVNTDWRGLQARFTWDQQPRPQVDMPLRLLGGMMAPPHSFPVQGLLFANDGDRRVTCWFPMPFAQHARIEIENRNGSPVTVQCTHAAVAGVPRDAWGWFHGVHRAETTGTGETFQGPRLAGHRGILRHVMLEDTADNSGRIPNMHLTHLEGDLCVRINGNRGCDHSFDASETSIGRWGWYLTPADRPFVADTSFNTGVQLRVLPSGAVEGARLMGSTFVFDPVHFVDGIDMVLEHGVQNSSNADYAFTAFLYAMPGAARRTLAEIDIGNVSAADPRGEPAHGVQQTSWSTYSRQGHFLRDQFFGTPMVTDSVRHIRDFLRFVVQRDAEPSDDKGISIGLRLDRLGGPSLKTCQADVFVDGQPAGLLHVFTHNEVYPWKEGGMCEVDLPLAVTRGKSSFTVELRPRPGSDPLRVARVWVYQYVR